MIIVTGGVGFIGSNIVHALNKVGHDDVVVVDDLRDGTKFINIADAKILDYIDKDIFINKIGDLEKNAGKNHVQNTEKKITAASTAKITAIIHQGACATTTEWDGAYMLQNNYEYSKILLHYCLEQRIPFIYASSAAVYGGSTTFLENDPTSEKPLNVYGYSKCLFDRYVQRFLPFAKSQIVGLRYFNVYGPHEQHKGKMASVTFHLNEQLQRTGKIRLFSGSDGYADGEQRRDFIYVEDVAAVNLWFLHNPEVSGIYNLGTGNSASFNDVARAVVKWHQRDFASTVEYIPFPNELRGRYQSFTEANINQLLSVGCPTPFKDVAAGVANYLDWLNKK